MFTRFQQDGLTSKVVGASYRTNILEPGGTYEPDLLIRRFLGRESKSLDDFDFPTLN